MNATVEGSVPKLDNCIVNPIGDDGSDDALVAFDECRFGSVSH